MKRPKPKADKSDWIAYADHVEQGAAELAATHAETSTALANATALAEQRGRELHRIKNG